MNTYVATSSKLLEIKYFPTEEAARAQVEAWERLAPCGEHDAETTAVVYTLKDWLDFLCQP